MERAIWRMEIEKAATPTQLIGKIIHTRSKM